MARSKVVLVALFLDGGEIHMRTKTRRDVEALLTVEDVAEYLAVPIESIHEMIAKRSIPHLTICEHLRFRKSDIDRWLDLLAVPCLDQAPRPVVPPLELPAARVRHRERDCSPEAPLLIPQPTSQISVPSARPLPPTNLPTVPASLGRGGPEYLYLQEFVKRMGEAHGFRVTIEQQILDGHGSVDVVMEREGWLLGCEILVTSTAGQEVGNVQKCLASGCDAVAGVSPDKRQIKKLRSAFAKGLTQGELARVGLLAPEELSAYFEDLSAPTEKVVEKTIHGYKVKVRYIRTDPEDEARRWRALAEVIGRSLLRMRKESGS